MTQLDALFTDAPRKGRSARCMVCGGDAPVRLQLVTCRVSKGGKPLQGQMHAESVRACEKHAYNLYAQITEILPT
jgi:hypothetical protein